jgi:hypothetical protein
VADEPFKAYVAEITEYPEQSKRADPIDREHVVQWGGVVGKDHVSAFATGCSFAQAKLIIEA